MSVDIACNRVKLKPTRLCPARADGVGLEKKEQMPLVFSEDDMDAMRQVRDAFAPNNRLNPGKIFPGGPAHQPSAHRAAPGMSI